MSNHHHLVVTDPRGQLPNFLRELHRCTAKAMNAAQGQWENLWAAEPCSAVLLADDRDIIDKIAYVATNPVSAGLVESPEHWPGLRMWTGGVVTLTKPKAYFREIGGCPAELRLRVVSPAFRHCVNGVGLIRAAIADKVASARRRLKNKGRTFVGAAGILEGSFTRKATSYEPKRGATPTVAAKSPAARKALLAIQKAFRFAYRLALDAWRAGHRLVAFPAGTWWMRVHHHASVVSDTG
jgi:hypothetical protein